MVVVAGRDPLGSAPGPGAQLDPQARPDARQLLLDTAARYLGSPASRLELVTPPERAPHVCWRDGAPTGLHAALSHGRGVVAVAVSELGPLGVDVEALRDLPAAALARRWFPSAECDYVYNGQSTEERTRRFLGLWTQKESVGKALGIGLRGSGTRRRMPGATEAQMLTQVPEVPGVGVAAWWDGAVAVAVACAGPEAVGSRVRCHGRVHAAVG